MLLLGVARLCNRSLGAGATRVAERGADHWQAQAVHGPDQMPTSAADRE